MEKEESCFDFGFPIKLIPKLACSCDAGLELGESCLLTEDGESVKYGTLSCRNCTSAFTIDDGILSMINDFALDEESKHEQKLRNKHAIESKKELEKVWWENKQNSMEMISTLEALSVNHSKILLELGCGDGRYTLQLSGKCQWILAVDFSLESLQLLKKRLKDTRNVALVLGDITTMKVSPSNFDCVLSTLVSNLPTRAHRNRMYQLVVNALKPNGSFIFSTHHHGFWQRLYGEEKSGKYSPGSIYRYNFTLSECKAEVRSYFEVIKQRPIQINFPFARRLRLPIVALSRLLERIPIINNLGALILCTAERPIQTKVK